MVNLFSFIRNTYPPFFSAFSFYHTAYKERINSVEQTLDVVEELRNYRPKHPTHKTTRTALFSGMGFSALTSSKQHFNPFNGALRNPAHPPSASREDSGSDADNIKETDRFTQQTNSKNGRGSIFSRFGGPPGLQSAQESDSSMETTQEKMKRINEDIELCPISSTMEFSLSSQDHLNSQGGGYSTITPISSPRTSLDGHSETVFKQATRVLKKTVLHDARNLSGRSERLAEWDINSAQEAKVHSHFNQSPEENTHYTYFSASGALDLPAT